jgi:hypothetical protein
MEPIKLGVLFAKKFSPILMHRLQWTVRDTVLAP